MPIKLYSLIDIEKKNCVNSYKFVISYINYNILLKWIKLTFREH